MERLHAIVTGRVQGVPTFQAAGGELLNRAGVRGHYEAVAHHGEQISLESTRVRVHGIPEPIDQSSGANCRLYAGAPSATDENGSHSHPGTSSGRAPACAAANGTPAACSGAGTGT